MGVFWTKGISIVKADSTNMLRSIIPLLSGLKILKKYKVIVKYIHCMILKVLFMGESVKIWMKILIKCWAIPNALLCFYKKEP